MGSLTDPADGNAPQADAAIVGPGVPDQGDAGQDEVLQEDKQEEEALCHEGGVLRG